MSQTAKAIEIEYGSRAWMVWPAVFVGLILLLYASVLNHLVLQWWTDADYGHGFFVPLFSGYVLWRERERWTKTEIKPANFGFVVMIFGDRTSLARLPGS